MKHLLVVVKPFRAEAVLRAVAASGADGEFSTAYLPKVEISVWVADDRYDALAERVTKAARTGRIGDGKVFVVPTAWDMIEF